MELKIKDENGAEWVGVKGLVNEVDTLDRFAIVGVGYKIAQHDDVFEIVNKALEDLSIKTITATTEMNDGARLRIDLKFPEITHSIAEEQLQLWATFDNSYDGSTGLRLEINAYLPATETNLYCSEIISEALNKYYHKHTKGLEIGMLEGTISKGIEIFQDKMKKEFEMLVATRLTPDQAKEFIVELLEDKKVKTAKKYLQMIHENIGERITDAWRFYTLIASILTKEVASVDIRKNNARELLKHISKQKWRNGNMVMQTEVKEEEQQYKMAE